MVAKAKQAAIRRTYRMLRAAVEKTQDDVTALARLDAGRFWKIENGRVFPTDEERPRIARALRVSESDLPSNSRASDAQAASA